MKNLQKELNYYLELVRNDFPTTSAERVRYMKNVAKCQEVLSEIGKTNIGLYYSIFMESNQNVIEFIIGWDYSKQPSRNDVETVKNNYSNKCGICSFPVSSVLHVHHIIPKRLGGKNDPSNLIAVCPTCHKIFHLIENTGLINEELRLYLEKHGYYVKVINCVEHLLIKPGVYQTLFSGDGHLNITPRL